MGTLLQDLRYAFRMFQRSPGFTILVIAALAGGIGVNTAVFTVLNGVLLRPLPFPEPERLSLLSYIPKKSPFITQPRLEDRFFLEFRRKQRSFEDITAFTAGPVNLAGSGDAVQVPAAQVNPQFFSVLQVHPAKGRPFSADEGQAGRDNVVLLSDKLWKSRFGGSPNIIGQHINLDGVDRTVIGILGEGFSFPYDTELWIPWEVRLQRGNSFVFPVAGRLKPGVSREQARAELESFGLGFAGNRPAEMKTEVLPLKELLVGDIRESLQIFAEAVAFVLLIACANVANLLLIRAARRQQEIAVRSALGAGRWRIVRQLLTESTLISLAGAAAGLLVAVWAVPALLAMAPTGKIPRIDEIRIDGWVLAFTVGIAMLTGILAGLAPAFQATRRELRPSLASDGRTSFRRGRLRGALVVAEIALTLILLTAAGLMMKSFLKMRSVNPGFRSENLLTMTVDLPPAIYRTPEQVRDFHRRTLEKLSALPGATSVVAVNWRPLGQALIRGDFQVESRAKWPSGFPTVVKPSVNPGYFRAMGIPVSRGREFTEHDDSSAPRVVVITELVARRFWPGEDPIGKRLSMADKPTPSDWLTIVGVVADIHQRDLTKEPIGAVYLPYLQGGWLAHMTFGVRTSRNPAALASAMRGVLRDVDRDQPVQSLATMDDLVAATIAEPLFQARLLGVFSILALALSALGIYGVLSYSVEERTREIGIRMALGAESTDVIAMVLRGTLLLAICGLTLGAAGAFALTRGIKSLLFDVQPTDPATFVAVAILLALVATLASLVPARRASRVDPLVALRYE